MKRDEQSVSLSLPLERQGWIALANAAQALLNLARVALGDSAALPVAPALAQTLPVQPGTSPNACTVAEAINDLLVAKARSGRSDRYLRALKNSLGQFAHGRSRKMMDAVKRDEIETWLNGSGWAGRTQKGYLGDVQTLFNFSVRRGYCAANPANGVEVERVIEKPVGIHTPDQVAQVLALAAARDKHVMRSLAIRYFAGLRASEAESITEADIKLDRGLIEVPAVKSKTRRRRLVTIQPVLAAWLGQGGALPMRTVGKRTFNFLLKVREAGIPWPHNAPRHSFCSYHLAAFENAAKTALEAGHSEQMLFQHYRALVSKPEAEKFWQLFPEPPKNPQ